MARVTEKEALIRRLEESRRGMGRQVKSLQHALDIPARLKEQVKKHPLAVFGGSAAGGWVVSKILRRPKKSAPAVKKGFWGIVIPFILSVLKPVLQNLLIREVQRRSGFAGNGRVS